MRCGKVRERLLLYLAGELPGTEKERVEKHLVTCAACATHAEELAETQAQLDAALFLIDEAPTTLEVRVMQAVRELPAPRRPHPIFRWERPPLAWAGLAACLAFLGFALGQRVHVLPSMPALDMAQLREAHGRLIPTVALNDPRQLSETLTAQTQFPVTAVDLKPEGAQLVGGSTANVQGAQVALMRYTYDGKPVSLFQVDAHHLAAPAPQWTKAAPDRYLVGKTGDYAYVAWTSGKTNCVMVARAVPMHLLFHLACHACEKQEGVL